MNDGPTGRVQLHVIIHAIMGIAAAFAVTFSLRCVHRKLFSNIMGSSFPEFLPTCQMQMRRVTQTWATPPPTIFQGKRSPLCTEFSETPCLEDGQQVCLPRNDLFSIVGSRALLLSLQCSQAATRWHTLKTRMVKRTISYV